MSTYLVTGGAGFIGSHLVTGLVRRGDRVRVLDDLSSGKLSNLEQLELGELGSGAPVEFLRGDVAESAALERAAEGVRGIFHEAAQVSVPGSFEAPERSLDVNALGTLRVLEAARAAGAHGVVLAASAAAYGNSETLPKLESMTPEPLSPYAIGKLAGEQLLSVWGREFGLHTASLRYFNVFGPRQTDDSPYTGVIAIFARALFEGRAPTINGDGGSTRDFVFVENVVQANLLAMDAELEPGEVINVGAGASISITELWRSMTEIEGVDLTPEFGPSRVGDVRHSRASLEKARRLLGYEPGVGWREGLEQTLAWYGERFRADRGASV